MNGIPLWVPLATALLGAIAAGLIQLLLHEHHLKQEKATILASIVAEVTIITEMIRFRNYHGFVATIIQEMEINGRIVSRPIIEIRQNYFSVFESVGNKIGILRKDDAKLIVSFYMYCKSAIDSTYPDGAVTATETQSEALENAREIADILRKVLLIGDKISQIK